MDGLAGSVEGYMGPGRVIYKILKIHIGFFFKNSVQLIFLEVKFVDHL